MLLLKCEKEVFAWADDRQITSIRHAVLTECERDIEEHRGYDNGLG